MAYFLVYLSTARHLMSPGELMHLLDVCRRHNAPAGITGALLYRDGTFLQVIEGERAVVRDLYDAIARDPRHHQLDVLVDGERPERQFDDWTMAFRDLTDEKDAWTEGFSRFLLDRDRTPDVRPDVAQRLMLSFRRSLVPGR